MKVLVLVKVRLDASVVVGNFSDAVLGMVSRD